MLKVNLSRCIDFTNIVKTSINVFHASMLDIVLDMFQSRFRVRINCCGKREFETDRSNIFGQRYVMNGTDVETGEERENMDHGDGNKTRETITGIGTTETEMVYEAKDRYLRMAKGVAALDMLRALMT